MQNSFSLNKFVFLIAVSSFISACGGSGGGGNTPAANPGTDSPAQQNYDLKISSDQCMDPFVFVTDYQMELASQIRFGDASCVKKILELGAKATEDVIEFGSNEHTRPLRFAIRDSSLFFAKNKFGSFSVVKVLVDAGANLDEKDSAGMNLLHQAIINESLYSGHPTVAGYIIQSGKIEINAKDSLGRSALHMALSQKQSDLALNLVSHNADINLKTREGTTPLLLSLQNGLEAFATSIVDLVGSVDDFDSAKSTALHLAIEQKFESLAIKVLARTKKVDQVDRNQETPLFKAVENSSLLLVKALLAKNANPDLGTATQAPIHLAIKKQVSEIVSILIFSIKDLEIKDSNSITPLMLAVEVGTDTQVSQLLARGALVDNTNGESLTALHLSVKHNFLEKIKILISANANVNALSLDRKSALYFAQSLPALQQLLLAKAVINPVDSSGATPLSTFVVNDQTELAVYLANQGADIYWKDGKKKSLLEYSVNGNNITLAGYFLKNKLSPNEMNIEGDTPLLASRSVEMVNLLVANGADINFKSKKNETLLTQKVNQYNQYTNAASLGLIQRILELGASPDIRDLNGNTLLMLSASAVPFRSSGDYEELGSAFDNSALLAILINYKSLIDAVNKSGDSAAHAADTSTEIKILAEAKANINLKNKLGETPLAKNLKSQKLHEQGLSANLEKLADLTAKLKDAEEKGNFQLAQIYKREVTDLTLKIKLQQKQSAVMYELIETLKTLGAN